jgi:hypothetical protein
MKSGAQDSAPVDLSLTHVPDGYIRVSYWAFSPDLLDSRYRPSLDCI